MLSQLRSGHAGSAWLEAGALPKLALKLTSYGKSKTSFAPQVMTIGLLRGGFSCAKSWRGRPKPTVSRMKL